jgi:hypothetical protein
LSPAVINLVALPSTTSLVTTKVVTVLSSDKYSTTISSSSISANAFASPFTVTLSGNNNVSNLSLPSMYSCSTLMTLVLIVVTNPRISPASIFPLSFLSSATILIVSVSERSSISMSDSFNAPFSNTVSASMSLFSSAAF